MSKATRFTEADLDRLRQRGVKVIDPKNISLDTSTLILQKKTHGNEALFALGRIKGRKMNKTEAAYAGLLETRKNIGEVVWYEHEPINLRIGENCFYKVDFLVMLSNGQLECHEVKGGFVTDDALVKIKAAAAKFPFKFIMIKHIKGNWEYIDF